MFVDPFAPEAVGPGGLSALSLTLELIRAGIPTLYWYGYSKPRDRCWAWVELSTSCAQPIWCGDIMVIGDDRAGQEEMGDIGKASTPGTGSGLVLANLTDEVVDRLRIVAAGLQRLYRHTKLPNGHTGSLDVYVGNTGVSA